MGGNVRVIGICGQEISATKMNLACISRSEVRQHMMELFTQLNQDFNNTYGMPLWRNEDVVTSGYAFNGSGEAFFDESIDDSDFVKVKRIIGDIDITVPACLKRPMWEYLRGIHGKQVTCNMTYVGNNRPNYHENSAQINALFNYRGMNVQIDFEFLPYDEQLLRPTEFSKFSHSSAWCDMQRGLKGVHHKYILRALAGGSSLRTDVQVITRKTSNPQVNPSGVTFNKFSVDRGLRIGSYVPVIEDGAHKIVNGLPAYHEVPTSQSAYITDVCTIAQHMLGHELSCDEIEGSMYSFLGIMALMKKYCTPDQIDATIKRMSVLYWGPGGQGFERDDPVGDEAVKMSGWCALMDAFPDHVLDVTDLKDKYYQNYRSTSHTDD